MARLHRRPDLCKTADKMFLEDMRDIVESGSQEMQSGIYEKLLIRIGEHDLISKRFKFTIMSFSAEFRDPNLGEKKYFQNRREEVETLMTHKQQKNFEKSYFGHFDIEMPHIASVDLSIKHMCASLEWFKSLFHEELLGERLVTEMNPRQLFVSTEGWEEGDRYFQVVLLKPKILRIFVNRLIELGDKRVLPYSYTPLVQDLDEENDSTQKIICFDNPTDELEFGGFSFQQMGVAAVKTRTGMVSCSFPRSVIINFKEVDM